MNQITMMLQESNARMKKIMTGKFDPEVIDRAQREADKQIKIVNSVISAFAIQSKNQRALRSMEKMNIIDRTTAIDLMLGDPEVDKVKCPDTGKLMTRGECLDYSGQHYEDCSGCEIGMATKDMLLKEV